MLNNTAILIFTRDALQEAQHKTLVATSSNQQLMAAMIQQTRTIAQSCSLDVFETGKQKGNTFGERLSNAMQTLFQQGYEQLIVIGNDTPNLQKKHILQTQELLQHQPVVVGPSVDGGIYLLGIRKEAFQAEAFTQLAWQTASLSTSLHQYINQQQQQVVYLEQLQDIDDLQSLYEVLSTLKNTNKVLYRIFCDCISIQTDQPTTSSLVHILDTYPSNRSLRAPPFIQ